MSTSVIFVRSFLGYATRRDLNIESLCGDSGLSRNDLAADPGHRISDVAVNNLWKNAVRMSGDPFFGLHFGEAMQPAALEVVGQVIMLSNTVGEALSHAARLIPFITDLYTIDVTLEGSSFTVHLEEKEEACGRYPETSRQIADYLLAFILHEVDGLILQKTSPLQACVLAKREDPEYVRVLRTSNITFGENWSLTYPASMLGAGLVTANYGYQKFFLNEIGRLQSDPHGKGLLKDRIFHHLLSNSYLYDATVGTVAANFNISTRSLQRKLKEERTSFFEIAEEVRKSLAIKQLLTGKYPVKEIAYSLGYNEASAFVKAFRRWTGTTPTAYLASHPG